MVVEFKDVAKAPKDLFKKPFNAGKIDVDIKSGAFTLKNSVKGGAMSSNLEMKGADALCGFAKGVELPFTKKYDGKEIKLELAKTFNSGDNTLAVDVHTTITPGSGAYSNLLKTKMTAANVIAGVDVPVNDPAAATFHAATDLKGITVGVSGGLSNISALNYCISPCSSYVLETNLKNFNLHMYNKVDSTTALACQTSWTSGAADSNFAVACKRSLASGADLSVKADVSGAVDVAHVSNLSDGIKMTLGANFNALNFGSAAPTFGAGFEFSF
jgi:hypothetical protein